MNEQLTGDYYPPAGIPELLKAKTPYEVPGFTKCGPLLIIGDEALKIVTVENKRSYICTAPGWDEEGFINSRVKPRTFRAGI